MPYQLFEVAISRYTFVDDVMQPPAIERGLSAVSPVQLKELIKIYQLCFIQPVLFMNKAVAIGSKKVVLPAMSTLASTRSYYAMVVCFVDGEAPSVLHVHALTKAFDLEPRQRFMSPDPDGGHTPEGSPKQRSQAA